MSMLRKQTLLALLLLLLSAGARAQDFRFTVQVNADQIQVTDKTIFKKLETAIRDFMNTRRWSTDKVQDNERIDCTLLITVNEFAQPGNYKATAQVQSRRTIFGTNYNSQMFNFNDEFWYFSFSEFQPMEYYEGQNLSNLTTMLAYYANIILGLDYDSFGPEGGTAYFLKAQNIVNICQTAAEPGWRANENKSTRNRYALIDNIMNQRFVPLRRAYYMYHRMGLDLMSKNPEDARNNIAKSLLDVQKVFKIAPNGVFVKAFFEAKSDEMVNIFKGYSSPADKQRVYDLLVQIDVANLNKYQNILKN